MPHNWSNGYLTVMRWNLSLRSEGPVQTRPPAIFIADSRGLDFLNSVATPVDTPVDWIDSGEGLLEWLAQAKFVPSKALNALKARAKPGELDKVAAKPRMREWFRGFVRKHMGRPLTPRGARRTGASEQALAARRRFSQISRHRHDGADRLELTNAALAIGGIAVAAGRRSTGAIRLRGKFCRRESVRRNWLHADVRRSHAKAREPLVQHGDLRQSRQAGGSP